MSEKLSNDVACGDDYSPDFSSEHVAKASNGDAEEHDDDDVVSVVDGGGVGEVVEDSPKSSRVPGAVPSALPSPSLEAASSPEGTPLTARKLFATPDSAMKVGETELKKSIQYIHSKSEKFCGTAFSVKKNCGKSARIRASFLVHFG